MIDLDQIGAAAASGANPADLIKQATGEYVDEALSLSDDAKYPLKEMPQAPPPNPFSLGQIAKGGR